MQSTGEQRSDPVWLDYAEFGERFVAHAVNEQRITTTVAGMTGRGVTIGPIALAPAGLASFSAEGTLGTPVVSRVPGDELGFGVRIPLTLAVQLRLGGRRVKVSAVVDIALTLGVRTAEPLLIVIEVAPVTARDVGFVLRAEAVDAAFEMFLDPLAGLIKREVAGRVNAIVSDPQARAARVFDIAALLDGYDSPHRNDTVFDWVDHRSFGRNFFTRIITRDRVAEVVGQMAGQPVEIGPMPAGPRGSATVTVQGAIEEPRLTERPAESGPGVLRVFDMRLPVGLDITVEVLKANRYRADLEIPLVLTARAAEPLRVVIDVRPPAVEHIVLNFKAEGMRAATLAGLAGIRKQVVAQVASVIATELADPSGRIIDVGEAIDGKAGGL